MSIQEFCELTGVDAKRFIRIENRKEIPGIRKTERAVVLVMEPEEVTATPSTPYGPQEGHAVACTTDEAVVGKDSTQ